MNAKSAKSKFIILLLLHHYQGTNNYSPSLLFFSVFWLSFEHTYYLVCYLCSWIGICFVSVNIIWSTFYISRQNIVEVVKKVLNLTQAPLFFWSFAFLYFHLFFVLFYLFVFRARDIVRAYGLRPEKQREGGRKKTRNKIMKKGGNHSALSSEIFDRRIWNF